jgi:hypothetical protein
MSQYTPLPIVVYVSRFQDKDSAGKFSRFVESYKKHPAGCEHELMIIKKGFQEHEHIWNEWIKQLDGFPITIYEYPDIHYVFGYLRIIMEEYPDRYILTCMSNATIRVDNWLDLYMRHAKPDRIFGSGGCYGALFGVLQMKFLYLYNKLLSYFGIYRKTYLNTDNYFLFPVPTLRTSGFMVPPNLLKSITFWPKAEHLNCREHEFLFEAGKYSLSVQAKIAGYSLMVVSADGKAYPMERWRESSTLITGNQKNLIIADHWTQYYDSCSFIIKKLKEINAYGSGSKQYFSKLESRLHSIDTSQIPAWFLRSQDEILK